MFSVRLYDGDLNRRETVNRTVALKCVCQLSGVSQMWYFGCWCQRGEQRAHTCTRKKTKQHMHMWSSGCAVTSQGEVKTAVLPCVTAHVTWWCGLWYVFTPCHRCRSSVLMCLLSFFSPASSPPSCPAVCWSEVFSTKPGWCRTKNQLRATDPQVTRPLSVTHCTPHSHQLTQTWKQAFIEKHSSFFSAS